MRKVFVLLAILGIAFAIITHAPYESTEAAGAAGPVGRNGLRVYPGPGKGEITVEWQRFFLDGENFNIRYGTASGLTSKSYEFMADHVGYISTYTLKNLVPGKRYYVIVEGIRAGNVSAGWDGEASTVAPSKPTVVVGTRGPVGRNLLMGKPGTVSGTVDLSWKRFFNDTQLYNIVYGEKPGQYIYGALDARDTTPDKDNYTYTVKKLVSGKRYYFALVPQRKDVAQYVTSEVSVVAR